jgi:hypothetical protein
VALRARLSDAGEMPSAEELAVGFVNTRSWAEARQFCREHPEVLNDDVDRALAALESQLDREGNAARLDRVRGARALLGACRRDGLELGLANAELDQAQQQAAAAGDQDRAERLSQVGRAWYALFDVTGERTNLDYAVDFARQAAQAATGDYRMLADLAGLEEAQFRKSGELGDLFHMADHQRAALRAGHDAPEHDQYGLQVYLAVRLTLQAGVLKRAGLLDEKTAAGLMTEAVEAARASLALTKPGSRERSDGLAALLDALKLRYMTFGSVADLDAAIAACQELASGWAVSLRALEARRQLALTLQERSKRTNSVDDLQRAADALAGWLAATPADTPPDRAAAVADLERWQAQLAAEDDHQAMEARGLALAQQAAGSGDRAGLDNAIELLQQALAAAPADHPRRGDYLANLGAALSERFEQTGALSDLDAAIKVTEQAVSQAPDGHPNRAGYLSKLSGAHEARYEQTGNPADLDAWIAASGQAVSVTPAGDSYRPARLAGLGRAMFTRYRRTRGPADLDAAIDAMERSTAATAAGNPYRAARLSNLSAALISRYDRSGALADLDAAIADSRQAVADPNADQPGRAMYLANLGAALRSRFERTGSLADLDAGIDTYQQAVAAASADDPERAGFLSNLGYALRTRFERLGRLTDLDTAIELGNQAVAATPSGHPDRAAFLLNLGLALGSRYERTGELSTLKANVDALEQAVAASPAEDPDRPRMLSALGAALSARYTRTGALADLDAAAEAAEQAANATPADHPDHALDLFTLGSALAVRYERTGELADLDTAIDCERQAVAATPADRSDRADYLAALGDSLGMRYHATGMLADLDASIDCGRQAVDATPADHPRLPMRLSNLAIQQRHRCEQTGAVADVDAAIELVRQALDAIPADHPDRALFLSNLGNTLGTRFERLGVRADLDAAIDAGREAVAAAADVPSRAMFLINLAASLNIRHERTGVPEDLTAAIEAFRAAAAVELASPRLRASAAAAWGRAAAAGQRWSEAVQGYEEAIGLVGRVVPRGLTRADQERLLTELGTLGPDAAACCLHAGQPGRAVELFEYGRGILLGQALDSRTDLTALIQRHQQLAQRFTDLARELDRDDGGSGGAGPAELSNAAGTAHRRREAMDAFDRVIDEIRSQPGFEGFLRPPALAELAAAAASGTLALVNVSRFGSDALLLAGGAASPAVVPLPGLSPDAVRQEVVDFLGALDTIFSGRGPAGEAALIGILSWLWDQIVRPILDQLNIHGPPAEGQAWPRLWWCPSGLLSFLPLHAAGRHETRFDPVPLTVIDRVVSSYIPTIRALMRARRPRGGAEGGRLQTGDRVLAVVMPHTPAERDLPGAQEEAACLQRRFSDQVTVLSGPDATHDKVLTQLSAVGRAHFACHGYSDLTNPSSSHLLLHDHQTRPLTVVDVARLNLDDADLAFLSACSTAQPGTRLTDEAIQLASAFQLAGYRHVIGTLWPIGDQQAVDLADAIYAIVVETGDPARATHTATRKLRNRWAHQASAWASHIHVGA